jgi:hypothetical protein
MSHIETTRLNDLIALRIAAIQKLSQALTVNSEVQEIEALLAELVQASTDMKKMLEAIPHDAA